MHESYMLKSIKNHPYLNTERFYWNFNLKVGQQPFDSSIAEVGRAPNIIKKYIDILIQYVQVYEIIGQPFIIRNIKGIDAACVITKWRKSSSPFQFQGKLKNQKKISGKNLEIRLWVEVSTAIYFIAKHYTHNKYPLTLFGFI